MDRHSGSMLLTLLIFLTLPGSLASTRNDPATGDIASFNIQIFGQAKLRDEEVLKTIVETDKYFRAIRRPGRNVVQRVKVDSSKGMKMLLDSRPASLLKILLGYDLILIQEIRDSSGDENGNTKPDSVKKLLTELNKKSQAIDRTYEYDIALSPRLGRTSSKEQYGFVYRKDVFTVDHQYTYQDTTDYFERPPFIVRFKSMTMAVDDFACIGIHTKPTDVKKEVDRLVNVYVDAKKTLRGVKGIIILGDFNAGCTYLKDWKNIGLAYYGRFYWLINDNMVTNTGRNCPYDRIVVSGEDLLKVIIPSSPGVFYFDEELDINKKEEVEKVSDHFPVHFQIKSKKMDEISFSTSYTFRSAAIANFAKKTRYDPKQVKGEAEALEALESIKSLPQTLIQNAQLHLKELSVLKHLPRGNGNYRTLYNYYKVNGMKYYIEYYDGVDEEGRKGGWMRIDIQEQ